MACDSLQAAPFSITIQRPQLPAAEEPWRSPRCPLRMTPLLGQRRGLGELQTLSHRNRPLRRTARRLHRTQPLGLAGKRPALHGATAGRLGGAEGSQKRNGPRSLVSPTRQSTSERGLGVCTGPIFQNCYLSRRGLGTPERDWSRLGFVRNDDKSVQPRIRLDTARFGGKL